MKAILQTLIILVVSLLVVGATYGVSQTSWGAQQGFGRRPPGGEEMRPPEGGGEAEEVAQNRPAGPPRERRGHHEAEGFSIFGILSFLPALLQLAVIIGGISWFKRWRLSKAPHG